MKNSFIKVALHFGMNKRNVQLNIASDIFSIQSGMKLMLSNRKWQTVKPLIPGTVTTYKHLLRMCCFFFLTNINWPNEFDATAQVQGNRCKQRTYAFSGHTIHFVSFVRYFISRRSLDVNLISTQSEISCQWHLDCEVNRNDFNLVAKS